MLKENPKLKSVFGAGFLFSLHLALTAYINSTFLSSFLPEDKVGLIFTFASLASILALLLIPKVLPRVGGYKFLLFSLSLSAIALFSLSRFQNAKVILPVFIIYFALNNVILFFLDEFLEMLSKNSVIGRVRGFYLGFLSLAWVLSQLFVSRTSGSLFLTDFYFISFILTIILLALSLFSFRKFSNPNYDKMPVSQSFKVFFKNKKLARVYMINFLLQLFYSWMVIYTPIYLHTYMGFSWGQIGTIFTFMLTPFVFLPFSLGRYADKIGERKMLMLGFLIASLSTFSIFFIDHPSIYLWALVLFGTRVGACTVEIMGDVYFFKHIEKENDEFIGIYRNTSSLAYIIGPLLASSLLLYIPSFNFLYPTLAAFLLWGVYLSSMIRKSDF